MAAAPVHDLAFRGLQFSYATWLTPSGPEGFSEIQAGYTITGEKGWATQGLCQYVEGGTCPFASWTKMPGNVSFAYGQRIAFSDDVFAHLGASGLDLGTGSRTPRSAPALSPTSPENGRRSAQVDGQTPSSEVKVTDNHLYGLPREYHGGVAILNGWTQNTHDRPRPDRPRRLQRRLPRLGRLADKIGDRRPQPQSRQHGPRQPDLRLHADARRRRRHLHPGTDGHLPGRRREGHRQRHPRPVGPRQERLHRQRLHLRDGRGRRPLQRLVRQRRLPATPTTATPSATTTRPSSRTTGGRREPPTATTRAW